MKKKILLCSTLTIFLLGIGGIYYLKDNETKEERWLSSITYSVKLYDNELKEVKEIPRGKKVMITNDKKEKENLSFIQITYENENFYVEEKNIVSNEKDVVKEDKIYVRTPATLYADIKSGVISGLAKKTSELSVTGYETLNDDGSVAIYHTNEGSIYAKYVVLNREEASKVNEEYHNYHIERGNTLGGGSAVNLDYYPYEKVSFADNVMPDKIYALYLNNRKNTIDNIDAYIEYAKTTNINAFVVDIKDNANPGYPSKVMEKLSKTNYDNAINTYEAYQNAIKKLKDAGFYVIGRITTFKDEYYAIDHPEDAIMDTRTSKPFYYADTYWPSPYQRDVWYFNVELAKEAVRELGFNEIQFDYVRFPDRSITLERQGYMDFKNEFEEEKAQAIQRFVSYATDEIHKEGAYVSIDVFGESAYTYVTAYGQYFPALSNIADVISGMPYPDHFARDTFGISEPWKEPYALLSRWSSYVIERQKEIPTPAKVRTWVAAYDSIIDGTTYDASMVSQQIQSLFDSGLTGGYMTWNSGSNLEKYQSQKEAYSKEY